MITTQRPLKIRQLLGLKIKKDEKIEALWDKDNYIFTHKSWVSLYTLFTLFAQKMQRKPIVLVPEYYCEDTLRNLRSIVNIKYYKINSDLSVDENYCKALLKSDKDIFDFIIVVHYFGHEYNFSNIKILCKNNNITVIEDAAHVAFQKGKIGNYGDFILYSPWKIYGLFDGAVLCVNCVSVWGIDRNQIIADIKKQIKSYPIISSYVLYYWRIKKILQRLIPNINIKMRKVLSDIPPVNRNNKVYQISKFSLSLLKQITRVEIEELIERKEELRLSIVDYLHTMYGIKEFFKLNPLPYAVCICVSEKELKEKIYEKVINNIGTIAYEWPELPSDIPIDSNAFKIKNELLLICLHDGISLEKLKSSLRYNKIYLASKKGKYSISPVRESEYMRFSKDNYTPISQSLVYVNSKVAVQRWEKTLWKVETHGQIHAMFSVLSKYGIIKRINCGPIYDSSVIDQRDIILIIQCIKEKFSGLFTLLFFAPNLEKKGININSLLSMNLKYRLSYYKTGIIDLSVDINVLRDNLASKWRNALKSAENKNLSVKEMRTEDEFFKLLSLHTKDKEERKYSDSGDKITKALYDLKSLFGIYVTNENKIIISFVIFALHGSSATYLIGWSNEEGYKNNANRLLLWHGMLHLKEIGYRWFDVGGINFIKTKGVAEFKLGTGCKEINYVGEFVAY